jgi:hypothetical protein
MPANNRVYYAVQGVRLRGPSGTNVDPINTGWDRVRGLQTVGINTNFNLEPIYQMGQLELYDNFEEVPEVEVTLNKVVDGWPLIYTMGMGTGALVDISNNRCGVQFGVFSDTASSTTGTPQVLLQIEPAYVSSATYTLNTDGNFTEDVTIVANDKEWVTPTDWGLYDTGADPTWTTSPTGLGIARRQQFSKASSILPSGYNRSNQFANSGGHIPQDAHVNSITITANLGREQIRELGQRTPYTRYVNFPVEITCEIAITAGSGDMVGVNNSNAACSNPKALKNQTIKIALCDGTYWDLGDKNKLTTVNYQGGDTGGGNSTITYSYQTYNDFTFVQGSGYGTADNIGFFESMGGGEDFNFQDGTNP